MPRSVSDVIIVQWVWSTDTFGLLVSLSSYQTLSYRLRWLYSVQTSLISMLLPCSFHSYTLRMNLYNCTTTEGLLVQSMVTREGTSGPCAARFVRSSLL